MAVDVPPVMVVPDAAASAVAVIESPVIAAVDEITAQASVPIATHDAITQPARLPPEMPIGISVPPTVIEPLTPDVRATPLDPPRPKSDSMAPVMDQVDEGWDLGDEDPTAAAPSTTEMAGDGSVEGDGLDQVD